MKSKFACAALIGIAFAAAATSSVFAQTAPGSTPSKPNKVTAVPPPPPPPGGPDKLATQTKPFGPGTRAPRIPSVVDDLAGDPNQAHADLPPGPGQWNCASENACKWLDAACKKAGGGMSQNPPETPGAFPTQTCTVN